MKNEPKALEQKPQELTPVQPNLNIESLITQAIKNNTAVETMEKLLAMRKELKAEYAKEAYDRAMAKFQSECPTIVKTKAVKTGNGTVAYKYAPIESIVAQIKDVLRENGFSYSTSMETLAEGVKVCVKVTHAEGHSETSCMQVPLGTKTNIMSQSQVVAAATTFAKRYAFCNAFGILTGDEDVDGQDLNKKDYAGEAMQTPHNLDEKTIVLINEADTLDKLTQVCSKLKKSIKPEFMKALIKEYTRRKNEIESAEGEKLADAVDKGLEGKE